MLYHLYVADEIDAQQICDTLWPNQIPVKYFDEPQHLSLLSIFRKIPKLPNLNSSDFLNDYHEYFELLYPSEAGAECHVVRFPDDLVRALADISDDAISDLAVKWFAIEPSFAKREWTKQDIMELLKKVCNACQTATTRHKSVLCRFSL